MKPARLHVVLLVALLSVVCPGPAGAGGRSPAEDPPGARPVVTTEPAGPRLPEKPYGLRQAAYDARYLARRPFTLAPRGRRKLYAVAASTLLLYLARDRFLVFNSDNYSVRRDGIKALTVGL